jgi:hypothetical protein
MQVQKISNTSEFTAFVGTASPGTVQFPGNVNLLLFSQPAVPGQIAELEEVAREAGRSLHLR